MAKKFNRTAAAVSAAAIALIPFAGVAQAVEVGFEDTVDVGPSLPTGNDASNDDGPAVAGPAAEAEVEAPAESDAPQVGAPAPVEQPVEEAAPVAPVEETAPVAPVEEQDAVVEETTTTTVEETTVVDDVVVGTEDGDDNVAEAESDVNANAGTAAYDNGQISAPQLATTGAPVAALTALAGLTLAGTGAAVARRRNQ